MRWSFFLNLYNEVILCALYIEIIFVQYNGGGGEYIIEYKI